MTQFYLQMSGVPGSGKSTLARSLAREFPAIVLDHDDTKSAILNSGVTESQAGGASYSVIKSLTHVFLQQGFSVIVDSPCLYPELLAHGIEVAHKHGARFKYIECQIADLDELDKRLRSRAPKPSQIRSLDQTISHAGAAPALARSLVQDWATRAHRPSGRWLLLHTDLPLGECVKQARSYMNEDIIE